MIRRIPFSLRLALLILLIGLMTFIGPSERSLGDNVRLVYLHGAWVWTAMITFMAAAAAGTLGLVLRKTVWQSWSFALGQTGLLFWITYLPLSMWTMQANWNGLYLAEPRWRIGLHYALIGFLLQGGLFLLRRARLASIANILYLAALVWSLSRAEQVMHPPSPIMTSDSTTIQFYFFGLTGLCLLTAGTLAGWWRSRVKLIDV
jgi:hypothetical protein